jgi:hypothetical protein
VVSSGDGSTTTVWANRGGSSMPRPALTRHQALRYAAWLTTERVLPAQVVAR